jgi:hypothetical protein
MENPAVIAAVGRAKYSLPLDGHADAAGDG